jgi:predicted HicB family RNase H-like nuclease
MSKHGRMLVKLNLRLQSELKNKLHVAALENGRSLNAEIVQRLMRSFGGGYQR